MHGYRPTTYGDGFADVYDDWYAAVTPPEATAAFLRDRLAHPGEHGRAPLVVELGSGTGRLAAPIGAAGLRVVGLDASTEMLRRSRTTAPHLPVVAADMAEQPFRSGVADAVLIAYNTLFNLPARSLQRRAIAQAVALLAPDGFVVVEAFVPGDGAVDPADHIDVVRLDADLVVLRISRTDPGASTVSGHHVELRDGQPVRLRPWHLCFAPPDELDRDAEAAGLVLAERHADWNGGAFGADSPAHISVYRPAPHRQ